VHQEAESKAAHQYVEHRSFVFFLLVQWSV